MLHVCELQIFLNYKSTWITDLHFLFFLSSWYLLFSYPDPLFPLSTLIFVLNYRQTSISSAIFFFFGGGVGGGQGSLPMGNTAGDWRREVWDQSIYCSRSWDHLGLAVPLKAGYWPLSYLLYTLFLGFQNSPSPGSFKTRGRDALSGFLHYSLFPYTLP